MPIRNRDEEYEPPPEEAPWDFTTGGAPPVPKPDVTVPSRPGDVLPVETGDDGMAGINPPKAPVVLEPPEPEPAPPPAPPAPAAAPIFSPPIPDLPISLPPSVPSLPGPEPGGPGRPGLPPATAVSRGRPSGFSRLTPKSALKRYRFGPGAPIVTSAPTLSREDQLALIRRKMGL
jgi:hypothetical protein